MSKPLSPKKATVTLGVPTPDPVLRTSLPLTPFLQGLRDTHFQKLAGVHSSSKSSESGPWAPGTFLKKPDWKPSNYRVDSAPRAALPAQLPTQLSPLQQGSSSKSITLTDSELRELEANHRRVELILNNQHWFVGASLVKLQEEEEASVLALPEPPGASPVIRPADLLLSAQRAGQDALRLNAYSLHNLILRRRDAAISTLPKDLADPVKRQLRCHPFGSPDLFNPDLCEHTAREYANRTQARDIAREFTRSNSGNRQRSSQPFPQAPSGQQRYDNRPPRDRQQQRPRNGGGGGGGGGPQQNPRGRGRGNPPSSSPSSYNKKGRGGGGGYRK